MLAIDIVIPMFNAEKTIVKVLESIENQIIKHVDLEFKVYIIDDCSEDNSVFLVMDYIDESSLNLELVCLEKNVGRSCARNSGASLGSSEYIIFLDSDCQLYGVNSLQAVARHFLSEEDYFFGGIKYHREPWKSYAVKLMENRNRSPEYFMRVTTACFGCRRSIYNQIGGFSLKYRAYGFEDRDLIIRLFSERDDKSKVCVLNNVMVLHLGSMRLEGVANKMREAGRFTSGLFMESYPVEYARTSYARVDMRLNSRFTAPVFYVVKKTAPYFLGLAVYVVDCSRTPNFVKHFFVKLISAMYFMTGTYEASQSIPKHGKLSQ